LKKITAPNALARIACTTKDPDLALRVIFTLPRESLDPIVSGAALEFARTLAQVRVETDQQKLYALALGKPASQATGIIPRLAAEALVDDDLIFDLVEHSADRQVRMVAVRRAYRLGLEELAIRFSRSPAVPPDMADAARTTLKNPGWLGRHVVTDAPSTHMFAGKSTYEGIGENGMSAVVIQSVSPFRVSGSVAAVELSDGMTDYEVEYVCAAAGVSVNDRYPQSWTIPVNSGNSVIVKLSDGKVKQLDYKILRPR
jgi:hypothetical protein